jgi:hypothetical protein
MSNSYSLSRSGESLVGWLSKTARELWLVATSVVMLTLISADLSAQLTYFSKSTATDFNSTASWGLNTDGSGAQPAAISNANNFVVRNNAIMTLSGPATVRQLTLTTGSLTITNQTLTVSRATGNNATFSVAGGTLNLSGTGSLVINGNYTHSSGFVFQSGGSMTIDPNDNNNAATSVPSGTHTFAITTTNGLYNGGSVTIVDPPVNTYAASSTRSISITTGANATQFLGTHTFIMGDGISTTPGNSDGFAIETYASSTVSIRNLTVNGGSGTNRYTGNGYGGSTSWGLWASGNLVVNANSEFRTTTAANCVIGGNITNSGTVTVSTTPGITLGRSFTVGFTAFDNLILGANVIGGAGIFRNGTAPTALFQNIIFNNPYGVIFNNAAQLTLTSPIVTSVQNNLNINQGTINLAGSDFLLGISGTPGSLTYVSGGFFNGSFTKWLNTGTLPASIGATAGLWPFSANGASRNFQLAASTAPTAAGTLTVSHNAASGLNTITTVEGMDRESNASWTVSAANGFTGGTYLIRANGDAVAALTAVGNSPRVLKASAVVGTHSAATGTVGSPAANRTAVAFADVTGTFTLGYAAAELGIFTVQSGAWDDPATWSNAAVPGVNDQVSINPGHNITVTTSGNVAGRVSMLGNSTLTVSAGDLTISAPSATNLPNAEGAVLTTGVLTTVTVSGTGTLSIGTAGAANSFAGMVINGTLNVNNTASLFIFGYLDVTATAFFFQTGSSTISVDGNEAGTPATSVGTNSLVRFTTGSLTFNGGSFLIVDPHAAAGNSLLYNPAAGNVNASVLHTFQFGDGTSTDAGGANAFRINQSGTPRLAFGQLVINASAGTNRQVEAFSNNLSVIGSLNIISGDFRINSGNTFHVNANVTNSGTLTTLGTLAFQNYQNLTATPSVLAQVLSGSGTFRNLAASPTGGFAFILFNNTGASGVTFSGTGWSATASTAVSGLTFTNGRVNIGSGTFTLGTATAAGTLTYTAGGFTGGTFRRGYANSAVVTVGTVAGQYPFVSATNDQRHFFFGGTVTAAGAGFYQVNYTDASGFTPQTPFLDAGISIAQTSNASWATSGTAVITANTGAVRLRADGLGIAQPAAGRVTLAASTAPGTSIAGSGTVNSPEANKNTIADVSSMSQTYRFGRRTTIESVTTGAFEDGSTWLGGTAPVAGDAVLIRNGHNVTVNAAAVSCGNLSVNIGGTLTVSGSSLAVGTTDNNNILGIAGSLIVSGGALNVNGNVAIFNGSTFTQTGGTITVDGNSGSAATSVPEGTQIFAIGTAAVPYATGGLTLNGGSIIIVDPHASVTATATSNATFAAFLSAGSEFQATHTLQLGNGSATNNGGTVGGYRVDVLSGAGRLLLGTLVVNAPGGTNREVNFINHTGVLGNFTVTAGQANLSANATFGGNVLVDNGAVLTQASAGTVNFGIPFDNSAVLVNPTAQSVSVAGTGIIRNNPVVASATANFTSILVGNTSTTGVTFNALNQITNAPANAVTVSGSITFGGTGIDARATAPSANGLVWGVFGTTPGNPTGSLTINANSGFATGSTYGRFYATALAGSTIAASADPTATTSRYPFVSPTGLNRSAFIERTGGSTAGIITSTFTHLAGNTGALSVTDGAYTVTNRMNSTWQFGVAGTAIAQTSVEVAIVAPEAFGVLPPAQPNVRIMRSNNTMIGTHQAGTTTPGGQRVITTVADLTGQPLTLGINSADLPVFTVQTGDWDDSNTWNIAAVPSATDGIQILAGHTVTVNDPIAGGSSLTVAATGALNITSNTVAITGNVINNGTITNNGGTFTIGGSAAGGLVNNGSLTVNTGTVTLGTGGNNDRAFTNGAAASWTVNGGAMNINGQVTLSTGGSWTHTGGTITVDPQGTTSVASGNNTFAINTSILNLTGGTVIIVDPNQGSGSALVYAQGTAYNTPVSSTHTWQLGDGVSTTGTSGTGFNLNLWSSSARLLLGNLVLNTLQTTTATRLVPATFSFGIRGDLTINTGSDFRPGVGTFHEGNIVNNGFLTHTSTLTFSRYESGVQGDAPNPQSIGGTGVFRNLAASPTANLTGLTIQNAASGGVTMNVPLSMSGTLTMAKGIINTTSANVLTMGTTTGVAGGTVSVINVPLDDAWVNGPMRRVFAANQITNAIINSTTALLPIGTGSGYFPARLLPRTTAGGPVTLEIQAFNGSSGTAGTTLQSLSGARRWEWSIVSGSANISPSPLGVFFGCQDPTMVSGNALAFAPTAGGTYDLPDPGTGPIGSTFDTGMLYFSSAVPTNPTDATTPFIGFGQTGPLEVASANGFQYTGFTQRSSTNVNTIGFVASMLGSTGGQTLNSVTITYTGTNPADIAANGVSFWVGTSLGPVTQLGSNVSFSGSTATISGLTQALVSGNNWFFVRLNVDAAATLGNTVDAQILSGGLTIAPTAPSTDDSPYPATAIDPAGNLIINYCMPTFTTSNGCGSNDFLTSFQLADINVNPLTCIIPSTPPSYQLRSEITTLEQGATYAVNFNVGTGGLQGVGLWIDFDDNGTFDATEFFGGSTFASGSAGSFNITIPGAAPLGAHRMRVMNRWNVALGNTDACATINYGAATDYTITVTGPTARALASVTAPARSGYVLQNTTNNNVFRFDLAVTGSLGALNLTSVTVNYAGTDQADIATNGVTLWTGTSTAPTTQLGTAQTFSAGSATFSGLTTTLNTGTNFLWVRLNTANPATRDNLVDVSIPSGGLVINATGGATATGTQPAAALNATGDYRVWYCAVPGIGGGVNCTNTFRISATNLVGATNTLASTGVCAVDQGNLFSIVGTSGTPGADLAQGSTYTVNVTPTDAGSAIGVWIDWNRNSVFEASENIGVINASSPGANAFTINTPFPLVNGSTLMRVRTRSSGAMTTGDACTNFAGGHTIDYWIEVVDAPNCSGLLGLLPTSITATTTLTGALCIAGNAPVNATFSPALIPAGGLTYQWQYNNGSWINVGSALALPNTTLALDANGTFAAGPYRVQMLCNGTATAATLTPVTINILNPTVTNTTSPTTRCGLGTISLTASSSSSQISWFAAPTGGSPLGTGATYPANLTSVGTTTFYVAASDLGTTANVGFTPTGTGTFMFTNYGIVLDVTETVQINSVTVYPIAAGNVEVSIRELSGTGTELGNSGVVAVAAGGGTTPVVITFPTPVTLVPGTGYRIVSTAATTATLVRQFSPLSFPVVNGPVSLVGGENGALTTGAYYYFYNVNFTGSCSSARVPVAVTATVPPVATLTASGSPVCSNTLVTLTATSGFAYTYTFPDAGVTQTLPAEGQVTPVIPHDNGSQVITYNVNATSATCNTNASVSVTVNPAPQILNPTMTPVSGAVCVGENVSFNATVNAIPNIVFAEGFDSGIPGTWTVTSNHSGTNNQALRTWNSQQSGVAVPIAGETYTTPDGTRFVLSDSDVGGSGSVTRTELRSPAFSTSGQTGMSLEIEHYFRFNGNTDTALVQMSLNGTTWTNVGIVSNGATPGVTYGTLASFVSTPGAWSIPVTFENQPVVYVRLYHRSTWGWYWAVNRIRVVATPVSSPVLAWAGPGWAGASTASASRTNLQLTDAGNHTFTATQNGCTSSITPFNVIVNAPPAVNITANLGQTTLCPGESVDLDANESAGSGTISGISWRRNGVTIPGISIGEYAATLAGTYEVTVTNSNGCQTVDTYQLDPIVYTVTPSVGANGVLNSVPSGNNFNCGTNPAYTADPNPCYYISLFEVDGIAQDLSAVTQGSNYTYTFTNISANHTINVTFDQIVYGVGFSNAASNGSAFTVSPAIVNGVTTINCGAGETWTFSPADPCDEITAVEINGVNIGTPTSYTVTNANQAISIVVRSDKRRYNVAVQPFSNGVLGVNGSNPGGNIAGLFNNLLCGTTYNYTVTGASGYVLDGVQLWDATNTTLVSDLGPVGSFSIPSINAGYTVRAFFTTQPNFNIFSAPIPLIVPTYPSCVITSQSLAGCTPSSQLSSFTTGGGNQDGWFRFRVPTFSTGVVQIRVESAGMNVGIALTDDAGNIIQTENASTPAVGAGERLTTTVALTPGTFYRVGVRNMGTTTAGAFTICVNSVRPLTCTSIPNGSLCSTFSGAYTGANQYTYRFINSGNPLETWTKTISGGANPAPTAVAMSTVRGLRYGTVYNVEIDQSFTFTNSAGGSITVPIASPGTVCTFTTVSQPVTELAPANRWNGGTGVSVTPSTVLSTSWVCGVVDYEWRVNSALSVNRGFPERFLRVNALAPAGVVSNGVYNLDIRPYFSDGTLLGSYAGDWGALRDINVVGLLSGQSTEESNALETADAVELGNGITASLYPNPNTGDVVYVQLNGVESDKVQIRVMDGMGRVVYVNQFAVAGTLNTSLNFNEQLTSGLYLVEYNVDGKVMTQRMVVSK